MVMLLVFKITLLVFKHGYRAKKNIGKMHIYCPFTLTFLFTSMLCEITYILVHKLYWMSSSPQGPAILLLIH